MATRTSVKVEAYLHAHGLEASPSELDQLLRHAIERAGPALYPSEPARDLTVEEADALSRGGFDLAGRPKGLEDPLAQGVAAYAALLKTSLSTEQAAARLGVEGSRIRQRLTSHPPTLYGIKVGGGWRLPSFQFEGELPVPGVDRLIASLDPTLHPLTVAEWFLTPSPDLVPEEVKGIGPRPLSPREWLVMGLPVEPVAELAASL